MGLYLYMRLSIILFFFFFINACNNKQENPQIIIVTAYGEIEAELYPAAAPKSVAAFLSYIDSGFYNRSSFYRTLNDENQASNANRSALIQGGIWKTNQAKAIAVSTIPHETTQQTGLKHITGTLSLARGLPGTAGTEFFICTEDQPGFDFGGDNNPDKQGYAAFGNVIKGMDVVKKIQYAKEYDQQLTPPVQIIRIERQ